METSLGTLFIKDITKDLSPITPTLSSLSGLLLMLSPSVTIFTGS